MLLLRGEGLCVAALRLRPLQPKQRGDDAQALLARSHVGRVGLQQGVAHDGGRALARWSRGQLQLRGVLGLGAGILVAAAPVDRDHLVAVHAGLADGARAAVVLHLEPAVDAGPAVEVAAQGDDGLRRELQRGSGTEGSGVRGEVRGARCLMHAAMLQLPQACQ